MTILVTIVNSGLLRIVNPTSSPVCVRVGDSEKILIPAGTWWTGPYEGDPPTVTEIQEEVPEPEPETQPFVVMVGNPIDGSYIRGPYATHDEAQESVFEVDTDWWIVQLEAP